MSKEPSESKEGNEVLQLSLHGRTLLLFDNVSLWYDIGI